MIPTGKKSLNWTSPESFKEEIDTAIIRLIIEAQNVMDVFDAAGIKKPDISIISDEFLQEVN